MDILNKKYNGKKVKIAFEDGKGVAIRIGTFQGLDGGMFILSTTDGIQAISRNKTIRIEQMGGGI